MTDPVLIRFPWFTLYGRPDRPGRFARWRCVAAMLAHELVELTAGTAAAHSMRTARRYLIGAPTIVVPASQRNRLYLTTVEDGFPDVYGDLVNGRVVELRVYSGGTVDATYESIFNPGPLVEVRLSNPTTNDWDLVGGAGADVPYLRVAFVAEDPATTFGGTYSSEADEWTIAALSTLPTTGDFARIAVIGTDPDDIAAASAGLFVHAGSGVFTRVKSWTLDDAGTWLVGMVELVPGTSSTVAWLYRVGAALGYTKLDLSGGDPFDPSAIEADIDALQTLTGYLLPTAPVKPNLHVSKYVTFDPDFPLDGTATHVGGQLIEAGQNITILDNSLGNGGVWTLSLTGPATRATGFGSVPDEWIAQYDHVGYTGTVWAYFAVFRLYGDPTTRGMSPTVDRDGITGGEGVTRSYRPNLIATDLTGDDLTVLNRDGTTTVVSVAAQTGTFCVLVLDNLTMVTIADGAVVQTEDFSSADGKWAARGWDGVGTATTVEVEGGEWAELSGSGGAVDSVNGQTGAVTLAASDVGADPAGTASSAVAALSSVCQPLDSDLTAIAALSTTSYGRAFLALADAAAARTALGLGTAAVAAAGDFQPVDSDLTAIAALSTTTFGRSLLTQADAAAARSALGVTTVPAGGASSFGGNQGYILPGVLWDQLANALALGADTIRYVPFLIRSGTLSVDRIAFEVTTLQAGSTTRVGVYAASSTWQPTGAAIIDTTASSATTGSKNITVSATLPPGRYLACIVANANVSVRSGTARLSWGTDHAATAVTSPTSAQIIAGNRRVGLTYPASLPNTGPAWTSADLSATNPASDPLILLRGTFS